VVETAPAGGGPEIVFCVDEFGPLNLQPRPGRQWAAVSGKNKEPGRAPRPRMRATYTRTAGVRHLFAAYELGEDKLFGQPAPEYPQGPPGWDLGGGEQRRDRLYADQFILVKPHIEAQFTALRYFALDGTDHASHKEQASMIRRYIIWRNNHAYDERLRRIVDKANAA
jgi:hypothetical protein